MSASKTIRHQPNQASYTSASNFSSVHSTSSSSSVKNNHPIVSNSSSNHTRTISSAGFGVKSYLNLLDAGSNPNTKAKIPAPVTKQAKVDEPLTETKTISSKYHQQTSTFSSKKLLVVQKLPHNHHPNETQFLEKKSMTVSDPYKILKEAKPLHPPIKIPPPPSEFNQILVNSKATKELFQKTPFSSSAALGEKAFENKVSEVVPTEIVKVASIKINAQTLQKLEERRKRYQTKVEADFSKVNEDQSVHLSQKVQEPEKGNKKPAGEIQQSHPDKNTKTSTFISIFSKNRTKLQKLVPTISKPGNLAVAIKGAVQIDSANQQAQQEEKSSGLSNQVDKIAPIKNGPKISATEPSELSVKDDSSKSIISNPTKSRFGNDSSSYKYHYRNSSTPSQENAQSGRTNKISEPMAAARRVYTSESEDLKEAYIELGPNNSDPEKNMDLSFDLENSSQFTSSANTKALQKLRSSAEDDANEENPAFAGLLTERIYHRHYHKEEDSPLASLSKLDARTLKKSKSVTYVQEESADELERRRGPKIAKANNHLKVPPLNLAIRSLSRQDKSASNRKATEDSFRDSKSDISTFVEVIQENNTEFVDLLQKMNLTKTGGENILLNEEEEQLLKNILDFIHNKDNFVSKEEAYSYRQKISDLERKLDYIASQTSFAVLKDNDDENSYRDVSLQDVEGMSPRSDNRPSVKKKSLFVPSITTNPVQINIIAASASASAGEESGNNKAIGSGNPISDPESGQIHTPNLPGTTTSIDFIPAESLKSQEDVGIINLDTVGNIDHPNEILKIPNMRGSIELPANSPHFKTFTPSFKFEKASQGLALENPGVSFGAHNGGNTPLMSPLSLSGTKQINITLNPSEENNHVPLTKSLSIIDAISNNNPVIPILDTQLGPPPLLASLLDPNFKPSSNLPQKEFVTDDTLQSPPDLFELFKCHPNDAKGLLHQPQQKFKIKGEPIIDTELPSPPDLFELFKRHPNDTKGLLHLPKQKFKILGEPIIDKELPPPPPVLFDLFKRHPTLTKGLLHSPKPVLKILGTPILDKLSPPPPSIIDLFQRHPNVTEGLPAPQSQAKLQQAQGEMPSRPAFLAELANRFKPGLGELNGQLRPNQAETKKKLKAVFIEKMNPESLKGTVYGEIHNSEHPTISFEDLHDLFENAPPQKPSATEQTQPKKPEAKSLITDAKRKHNISIMIMKFRKWPLPQLKEGIINFDPEILTPDACSTLLPFCLLPDEIRACQSNKDPIEKLDAASQFLLTLSEIPQMGPRLRCTILKSEFHQRFNTIMENFNKLKAGCDALRNNPHFKVFLKLSLDVANTLNEGTARGAAMGLKPASLLSFDTVRSNKPGMTLLVYMLKKIYEQKQEILKFTEDFLPINEAVKINVDDLLRNLMEIKNEVEQIKIHLASSAKLDPPDTYFINHFTPFYEENSVILAEALENSQKIKAYYIETAKFLGEDDESLKKKNSTEFFKVFKQLSDTVRKFKTDEDERRKREARKAATVTSLKKRQDPPC